MTPIKVTRLDIAFPASVRHMMPPYEAIPERFKRDSGWASLAQKWFFTGLPAKTEFLTHDGINRTEALGHLKCVLGSFEPKHEHKIASAAYLMALWFKDVRVDGKSLVMGRT